MKWVEQTPGCEESFELAKPNKSDVVKLFHNAWYKLSVNSGFNPESVI